MQLTSVYLYRNLVTAYNNAENPPTERFRKVYNRNLKIYKSVDNRIDIHVKNYDQKSTQLATSAVVFNLILSDTNELVLKKDCVIRDAASGRVFVNLSSSDLKQLKEGNYKFSIVQETRESVDNGSYVVTRSEPLYVDSQFGVIGFLKVFDDVYGKFMPSTEISIFNYTNPAALGESEPEFHISSIVDAQPIISKPQRVHTFQFYYSNDWEGKVEIQVSIEKQSGTPYEWVTVKEFTDARTFVNITGKYSWFRIRYTPTEGKVEKVLYR